MAKLNSFYDLLAMNQQDPMSVAQDGVPAMIARDPSQIPMPVNDPKPSRKTLGAFDETGVMGQSPMPPPAPMRDYEAEISDLYRQGMDRRSSDVEGLQGQLSNLGDRPSGFNSLDLSPLAAFVDSTTGSNLSQGIKAPTHAKEYDQKKALLQQALSQGQDRLSDDQLGFLKMKADERKADEAGQLRQMMYSQRAGNQDDTQEHKLREQYMKNPMYKHMGEISKAFEAIENNPAEDGPAQQALVYQFSRILDPESVVRESEYAMSAANSGKITQARQFFDSMMKGERLSPDQIRLMKEVSRNLVMSARKSLDAHNEMYSGLAKRKGIAPENVIMDSFYGSSQGGGKPPAADPKSRLDELRAKYKR